MATPGGPRPGNFPPNYNPNSLANNMQNLNINQPNQQQPGNAGAPRPPNSSPFGQQPPPFAGSRPGPPPPGVFPRAPGPPNALPQSTLPPNMVPNRPTGPPPGSQPPPFASRPPPPGVMPPSIGGPVAPSPPPPGPRPGSYPSSPMNSAPSTPFHGSGSGPISNGPPTFAPGMGQSGQPFPPAMGGSMPRPFVGPPQPPTMVSSRPSSQPMQMRPNFGSPPTAGPSAAGQPALPFSGPPQNMVPPLGSSPFSAPNAGMQQPLNSPYGMQTWPAQPQQVSFINFTAPLSSRYDDQVIVTFFFCTFDYSSFCCKNLLNLTYLNNKNLSFCFK